MYKIYMYTYLKKLTVDFLLLNKHLKILMPKDVYIIDCAALSVKNNKK